MSGLTDGTRIAVTGNPTPEEVAALVVALNEVARQARTQVTPRLAWQVAARHEATGHRAVASPWELPPG